MRVKSKLVVEMGRKACPSGKIWRKGYRRGGYRRKDGTRVDPATVPGSCVVDRGAPGKTPEAERWAKDIPGLRGPLPTPGPRPVLGQKKKEFIPGWEAKDPAPERRAAVRRDARREGCLTVSRKLVVVHNLNYRTNPTVAKKAMADRKWAVDQGWCRLKTKRK